MHDDLRDALANLERRARRAGRSDLVHHIEGCWYILEGLCQAIDAAHHGWAEAKEVDKLASLDRP